jgi:hypothetical protein
MVEYLAYGNTNPLTSPLAASGPSLGGRGGDSFSFPTLSKDSAAGMLILDKAHTLRSLPTVKGSVLQFFAWSSFCSRFYPAPFISFFTVPLALVTIAHVVLIPMHPHP